MSISIKHAEDKLVALASIAAELSSVVDIALNISQAGKNAKEITVEAGDNGLGFLPITESIDEISQQVMSGIGEISDAALQLSKIAVHEQRSIEANRIFDMVIKKHSDAQYISSMSRAMREVENNMRATMSEFRRSMNQLTLLLEAMDQCMLSARAIASVSRIVTSDASEYRDKLKVVADSLDNASISIKQRLANSYQHLNHVTSLAHKDA